MSLQMLPWHLKPGQDNEIITIHTRTNTHCSNFRIIRQQKRRTNLWRDTEFQEQRTQNESPTKSKQTTNHTSNYTKRTMYKEFKDRPFCMLISLGLDCSLSCIQTVCFIKGHTHRNRNLKNAPYVIKFKSSKNILIQINYPKK